MLSENLLYPDELIEALTGYGISVTNVTATRRFLSEKGIKLHVRQGLHIPAENKNMLFVMFSDNGKDYAPVLVQLTRGQASKVKKWLEHKKIR